MWEKHKVKITFRPEVMTPGTYRGTKEQQGYYGTRNN